VRVEGWEVGEVILRDDKVFIPFKRGRVIWARKAIAWDSN